MQIIKKSFSLGLFFLLLFDAHLFRLMTLSFDSKNFSIIGFIFILFFISIFIFITIMKIKENIRKANLNEAKEFIQNYTFPPSVKALLRDTYPLLTDSQIKEVFKYLRLFLIANLFYYPNTPSHILNRAWKAFSLSDEYESFCHKIFKTHFLYEPILKDNSSNKIIEFPNKEINFMGIWKSQCHNEDIDPFFPQRVPSMFMLDKTLNIADGIKFQIDEVALRGILNIKYAPSPRQLIGEIEDGNSKEYLAKKLQYYLSNKAYCGLYQELELEDLLKKIQNSKNLSKMVFGTYSDIDFFNVLKNSAPPPDVGCCSGASI